MTASDESHAGASTGGALDTLRSLPWPQILSGWAACVLGLQELPGWRPDVLPFDALSLLAAPLWLYLAIRQRVALGRPAIVRAWLLLSLSYVASAWLASGDFASPLSGTLKGVQMAVVVLGFAAVARESGPMWVVRGWLWGALACLMVAHAGYAVTFFGGVGGLAHEGRHPIFDGLPRMVGTFGAPQHFGEYVMMSLGVAYVSGTGHLGRLVRLLGWAALFLTFSSAWVGGACLALGLPQAARFIASPKLRAGIAVALAVGTTWLMTFSLPSAATERMPMSQLDLEHVVVACTDAQSCQELRRERPYPAALTHYRMSKELALRAGLAHLPFGIGPHGYEAYAEGFRRSDEGISPALYRRPHSTPLGVFAELGIPGLLALMYVGYAIALSPGDRRLHPVWLATLGLLLVGLNIDVLRQRHLWVALGLLAGATEGHGSEDEGLG